MRYLENHDRVNIAMTIIHVLIFGLLIGIFTFDLGQFKTSSQAHARFNYEYVVNDDRYRKLHCPHVEIHEYSFDGHLTLVHFKG